MTLTSTISDIAILTTSNIISNLAWIILFYWGVKYLGTKVSEGIKQVPNWIETYHKKQMERIRVEQALDRLRT